MNTKRKFSLISAISVLFILLANLTVKATDEPISIKPTGELEFNFKINSKDVYELKDEGIDVFVIYEGIECGSLLEDYLTIDALYMSFGENIEIDLQAIDEDTSMEYGEPIHVSLSINGLFYEIPKPSDTFNRLEVVGNEIGFRLDFDNSMYFVIDNNLYLRKSIFKDFSSNYKVATIKFFNDEDPLPTSDYSLELDTKYLFNTLVSKTITIDNDNEYLYVKCDDSEYLNNISFIHIYGIDYLNEFDYEISDRITIGNDQLAYDLNSTISILDGKMPLFDAPIATNNEIKIPLSYLESMTSNEHDGYCIDLYNHDYVTYHSLFDIETQNPKPEKPSNPSPVNTPVSNQTNYRSPNTSVH